MQLEEKPLLIRADANASIGTGHLMRCLALAQAWQDVGGHAIFAMAMEAPALEARLKSEEMDIIRLSQRPGSTEDAIQTAGLAQRNIGASWIVVDGYHFGADYQRIIKGSGLRLLFIDDNGHAEHYYADIILNQNIHAHEDLYANREPYTRLLLGTRYVLLRREFTRWREWKREIPNVARKVLVTLGGSDPDNKTLEVVRALQQMKVEDLEVVVVVGAGYSHCAELQSAISGSPFSIRLQSNVANMPELIAWADMAIAAGGTTSWELAFMGLPSLILALADNQKPVAEWLDAKKVAIRLGSYGRLSDQMAQAIQRLFAASTREQMSRRGRDLVDGKGCNRVLRQLKSASLKLRPVREGDCKLLWEWANDPDVRIASFSSDPISWEQHVEWFNVKISDPNCIIYIALNDQDVPLGQVRYDIANREAVISITVDRQFRSQGYGSAIIKSACENLFTRSDVHTIHAYIKSSNEASVRAFVKAGFKDLGKEVIRECQSLHLILQREMG